MDWVDEMSQRLNLYAQVQLVAAKMKAETEMKRQVLMTAEESTQLPSKKKKA